MATDPSRGFPAFLALPYAERQYLLVVKDPPRTEEAAVAGFVDAVPQGSPGTAGLQLASANPAKLLVAGVVGVTTGAICLVRRARRRNQARFPRALQVSPQEAAGLQFPPGHPQIGTLYVGHPLIPPAYYPTTTFHRFLFEHKFAEAINLLMSLGARRIEIEHVSGWVDDFTANLRARLGPRLAHVSGGAERRAKSGARALFEASLSPSGEPSIPNGLVWYPHEPTCQQVAEGRLKRGLETFALAIEYDDDYGVDGTVAGQAKRAGIDLGGKFVAHRSTIWRVNGEFGLRGASAQARPRS